MKDRIGKNKNKIEPQRDKSNIKAPQAPHDTPPLCLYEPPHDKTNKMTVRPAKTQISLGIRPV